MLPVLQGLNLRLYFPVRLRSNSVSNLMGPGRFSPREPDSVLFISHVSVKLFNRIDTQLPQLLRATPVIRF